MKIDPNSKKDLSAQISQSIQDAIISGELPVDERLPSEVELAEHFAVSRSSVREALKRLAAKNLIRTQRGAFGGAFVSRLTFDAMHDDQVANATLLISMNDVSFSTACEARFAMERTCLPLAIERRSDRNLQDMKAELSQQTQSTLSDAHFCASDVAFHRALIKATGNPVLEFNAAAAVCAMQPLMTMITFSERSRTKIIILHGCLLDAMTARRLDLALDALSELEQYSMTLGQEKISRTP
ncbi:MAG: GntR family transcriptional regulator [Litoreibacter sp.]